MPNTELSKPTILVVDDEMEILKLLTHALQRYGLEVLTADESSKAVEIFSRHRSAIDLVLMDVQMPTSDRVKMLVDLQRIDPDVLVAIMSATPGQFTKAGLLKLGVVHVFDKPFRSLKHLAETLKELIR
jgi:DNA-binding NtrC family response regulator